MDRRNEIMKVSLCVIFAVTYFASSAVASCVPDLINCHNNTCMKTGRLHTMCKYPSLTPSAKCNKVLSVGLTQAEKTEIVNKHNELRQFVASGKETRGNPGPQFPAKNMKIMSWDDELAEVAQRWAIQCIWMEDECRDVERFVVGQSIAGLGTTGTADYTPSRLIMQFYDEVDHFNRNEVHRLMIYNFPHTYRYTQLVWANTDRVGCGKIVQNTDQWNNYYLICNYGPAGNHFGAPVYEVA